MAAFVSSTGIDRAVFLTRTRDGRLICLRDTNLRNGEQGGGCNSASDFFAGRELQINLAFDGGPSVEDVTDARIVGVVTERVARVEIMNWNGEIGSVAITPDRGFAYVVPRAELRNGVQPTDVVAYDTGGTIMLELVARNVGSVVLEPMRSIAQPQRLSPSIRSARPGRGAPGARCSRPHP